MNSSELVSIVSFACFHLVTTWWLNPWECRLAFVSTLLKDIRLERARVTEKDKLRLLFVTKFFLEYFLVLRAQEQSSQSDKGKSKESEKWSFGLIAEVIERDWIVWVLKRMREAVDEKVCCSPFLHLRPSANLYIYFSGSQNYGPNFKQASNV